MKGIPERNNRDATCEEASWRVTTPTVGCWITGLPVTPFLTFAIDVLLTFVR